jgi:RHS repeat-associated protein
MAAIRSKISDGSTATTLFIGAHYEISNPGSGSAQTVTKYYFAGAQRIAVRKSIVPQSSTLTYLLGDHLGSTSLAVDASTGEVVETRYKPWGEVRYTTPNKTLPTRFTFTGQYSYVSDEATDLGSAGFGLMFYNARFYDPALGRFSSPDTIIPGENISQSWDRYAYVGNNPVKNTDPDGHCYPLCTMAIGAAVGAVAGAAIYTYYNHGQDFSYNGFALSVGVGIVAGGIAGTGVGLVLEAGAVETAGAANVACGGDMCASEAQDAEQALQETLPIVEKTIERADAVIGNYSANRDVAKQIIGAKWHDVDPEIWRSWPEDQQWNHLKLWLDETIQNNGIFRLATAPEEAENWYRVELGYIQQTGKYIIDETGKYFIPK